MWRAHPRLETMTNTKKENPSSETPSQLAQELFDELGVSISPDLLIEALTHRSFANEHPGTRNYERLEFLGDAVLELVATETLYKAHPNYTEGQMSKIRSKVVSEESLAEIARDKLKISPMILLGIGERRDGGADKDSILCDIVESLFGAIFVEYGIETARKVIHRLLDDNLHYYTAEGPALDWKTAIVVKAHELDLGEVNYQMEVGGPSNRLKFTAHLFLVKEPDADTAQGKSTATAENMASAGNKAHSENPESSVADDAGKTSGRQEISVGHGSSKRKAQLDAAEKAWRLLAQSEQTAE